MPGLWTAKFQHPEYNTNHLHIISLSEFKWLNFFNFFSENYQELILTITFHNQSSEQSSGPHAMIYVQSGLQARYDTPYEWFSNVLLCLTVPISWNVWKKISSVIAISSFFCLEKDQFPPAHKAHSPFADPAQTKQLIKYVIFNKRHKCLHLSAIRISFSVSFLYAFYDHLLQTDEFSNNYSNL